MHAVCSQIKRLGSARKARSLHATVCYVQQYVVCDCARALRAPLVIPLSVSHYCGLGDLPSSGIDTWSLIGCDQL
jgi:hypothetical protein